MKRLTFLKTAVLACVASVWPASKPSSTGISVAKSRMVKKDGRWVVHHYRQTFSV